MRRTSVSLPTRNVVRDPYEKADRYQRHTGSSSEDGGVLKMLQSALMGQTQRARYLKTGGFLLLVISLLYYLSPAGVSTGAIRGSLNRLETSDNNGQSPSDSTYGTTNCKKSYSKEKPIVQYVLMIDAGSTGSRIHVYKFNNCGPTPELEEEKFEMTKQKPGGSGLSSYDADAEGAAKSLDVLMDVALANVPKKLQSCSPVAVKATAGLRKLGEEKSQKILEAVRQRLENNYPFPVVDDKSGGVEVMEGKDEGVYAWITTNYLLGKIGGPDQSPTAAVFDLGGGSTQIVFQPTFPSVDGGMPEKLSKGDHRYELSFGGRQFELYQHSHLGYGLMAARETIHLTLLAQLSAASPTDHAWTTEPITNPCIAPGMTREVKLKLPTDHVLASALGREGREATFNMTGPTTAAPAQCRKLAEQMLYKDAECALSPCSFNGIHQPSLAKTFAKEDVYTFSYFYDRTQPLGMPDSFTLRELQRLTGQVCGGAAEWNAFASMPGAMDELKDRPEWCLDLNFMLALLHTGYEMPIDREVKIAKKIKGNELGWCLGASLPLLEKGSGWQCRVQEIH